VKTILLVEEDVTSCELLKYFIESNYKDVRVLCGNDKDVSLKLIQDNKVDIVIVNVWKFTEKPYMEIISLVKTKYDAMVFITTTAPHPMEIAKRMGANYGIKKPYTLDDIQDMINTAL
jgi:DNA-binding NtrC family response regulator